ncbi:MAG TPA: 30S ribosomal protein S4 [Chloroflexota bacterium]|nr:30S ribosomal protein S4 [Chloroflexota bacterium]
MAIHGPKWKVMRRYGVNLFGTRSAGLNKRLEVPPGQHGRRRARKPSEYSLQLREKQKARLTYGANERQFRRAYERALRLPGRTGEAMMGLLERRLDNAVYRLGFAPTRPMARQMVNHGHVLVNGRKVSIPSYEVKPGDTITLGPKAQQIPDVQEAIAGNPPPPSWLTRAGTEGRVTGTPQPQDVEPYIQPQRIVEYYSR